MEYRWMKFHTMFRSLRDEMMEFLGESGIPFTLGGSLADWTFEIFCNDQTEKIVSDWLKSVTITE